MKDDGSREYAAREADLKGNREFAKGGRANASKVR
jgi:hypothetical protein